MKLHFQGGRQSRVAADRRRHADPAEALVGRPRLRAHDAGAAGGLRPVPRRLVRGGPLRRAGAGRRLLGAEPAGQRRREQLRYEAHRVFSRRDRAASGTEGGGAGLPRRESGEGLGARLRHPGGPPRLAAARWSSPHERPAGLQAFAFNTRRPIFADRRVREALGWAFDFEWTNRVLFFDQYRRATNFFNNSEMASRGLPEGEELAILEKYRGRVPEEVFTSRYPVPVTDGSGWPRGNLSEGARPAPRGGLGGARHAAGERARRASRCASRS